MIYIIVIYIIVIYIIVIYSIVIYIIVIYIIVTLVKDLFIKKDCEIFVSHRLHNNYLEHIKLASLAREWLLKIDTQSCVDNDIDYVDFEIICKFNECENCILRCYDKEYLYKSLVWNNCQNNRLYNLVWCDLLDFDIPISKYFSNMYVNPRIVI